MIIHNGAVLAEPPVSRGFETSSINDGWEQSLRPIITWTAGFSLFVNMLMVAPAIYMLQVYDRALLSRSVETLTALTLILVVLIAAMGLLEWVRSTMLLHAMRHFDSAVSNDVFKASFARSDDGTRTALQRMADFQDVRAFLGTGALFAIFDIPWVPIYVALMYLFHPLFGIFATFAVAVALFLMALNHRASQGAIDRANDSAQTAKSFFHENLVGREAINAMGMLHAVRERWQLFNQASLNSMYEGQQTSALITAGSRAFRMIVQSLALGLGAWLAIQQEISPGMMIAGSILLGRALAPIDQIVASWRYLRRAWEQLQRLRTALAEAPSSAPRLALPPFRGGVCVQSVGVERQGRAKPILDGVSFSISPGSCLAVLGASGSGKTTLARALVGASSPDSGSIRLDGAEIDQYDPEALGNAIGYLPQDIEILSGTVADNIARFGEIEDTAVVTATRHAGVHEMILALEHGYETVVDADRRSLSGGQVQRIALARAIYRLPKLVVMDEPNSNLDESGLRFLNATISTLKASQSTTVVVTHRASLLAHADEVLVLGHGRVIDHGPRASVGQRLHALRHHLQREFQ